MFIIWKEIFVWKNRNILWQLHLVCANSCGNKNAVLETELNRLEGVSNTE